MTVSELGIATATRCSCGAPVYLSPGPGCTGKAWEAICHDCYDGADDAGERAHVRGWGDTTDAALWDWQDKHDAAHEVEWCLTDLFGELAQQVGQEHERQRGWVASLAVPFTSPTPSAFYGPEPSP